MNIIFSIIAAVTIFFTADMVAYYAAGEWRFKSPSSLLPGGGFVAFYQRWKNKKD